MKSMIAIGCLLLAVSSARAQFIFLNQQRSVSARAELRRNDHPLPENNYHLIDNPIRTAPDFGPFNESVTADLRRDGMEAHASAWQESNLSAMQIVARGGPRDVGAFLHDPANNFSHSRSDAQIAFRLDSPTYVHIFGEIFDPPSFYFSGALYRHGDISLSITGPQLSVIHAPNGFVSDPESIDVGMPAIIDETTWLPAGDYQLDISGVDGSGGDTTLANAYFDLRLTVVQIPEPHPVVMAAVCSALFALFRWLCAGPFREKSNVERRYN
jgi:hypothetical protein